MIRGHLNLYPISTTLTDMTRFDTGSPECPARHAMPFSGWRRGVRELCDPVGQTGSDAVVTMEFAAGGSGMMQAMAQTIRPTHAQSR